MSRNSAPRGRAAAVVVNWNSGADLGACLDAIAGQREPFAEVVVVDNGSTDGSAEAARERGVRLIALPQNLGYGAANNQGIAGTRGELVALINPDVRLDPGWLGRARAALEADPGAGQCAGKVLHLDDPSRIENTGHLLFPDGLNRARSRNAPDNGGPDALGPPLFASGCAALYRRSALEAVGGLCEELFAYGDDAELGLRLRLAGWGCAYASQAVAHHRLSGAAGRWSADKAYLVERNRLWVLARTFPAGSLLMSPLFTAARHALQAAGALSGRGAAGRFVGQHSRGDLLRVLVRAYAHGLAGLPRQRVLRRRIRRGRPWPDLEFYGWLWRHRAGLVDVALGE